MSYPQPKGPDLVDRTKQDLKQTSKKVGGFFKKYKGEQYSLFWTYGIVLLCGVIFGIYWLGTKIRYEFLGGKQELAKTRFNSAEFWLKGDPGQAFPMEINGDGTTDFLGGYHGLDPSGDYLGAFDGKTGNVLWRVGPLKFGMGPTLYTTDDKVLIVSYPQDLTLVELKTGKLLKKLTAPHAIRQICPDPSGKPSVVLRNYRQYTQVSLTDLSTSPGDDSWCGGSTIPGVGRQISGATAPEGMNALTTQVLEDAAGNRYFSGKQTAETFVDLPVLIAQDKAGKQLWRKTYQGKYGPKVAVAEGRVYAVTNLTKPAALYAYDAASGKELWKQTEVKLLAAGSVSASKEAVYVQVGRGLCIFQPTDGKLKATLGDETAL
ncbi:MAG: PQQ-binding-like beta-propeller repeat protein [Polyangiaceae bacterium]